MRIEKHWMEEMTRAREEPKCKLGLPTTKCGGKW